ncbi:MAG: hypothetical protein WBN18_08790 [Flavobacteriaceae bacterium]
MRQKKGFWVWNLLLGFTVVICALAFLSHSRNWIKLKEDRMRIISGFYINNLDFAALDSVVMVERLPPMIRLSGFSAFDKGKGIYREFKDTLTDKKVFVFIDNFSNQKIRLVKKDSDQLFVNLKDSLETDQLFQILQAKASTNED